MENNNVHVHVFTETVVPPTCREKGYTLHKCECGYEHRDNFKPTADHDYDTIKETKPTCTESGKRKAVCKVCGAEVEETVTPLGHNWSEWNINTFSTCTEEGSQTRICTVCGTSETQATKPTGHKFAQGQAKTVDGYIEHFCENCGETVKMPTRSTKIKNYIKAHKLKTIGIPSAVIAVSLALVLTFLLILPAYHYNKAHELIEQGEYAEAFNHMVKSRGYKDATKLLDNFIFEEEKSICLDEDGKTTSKAEGNFDKHGNSTYFSGSYIGSDGEITYNIFSYKYEYNADGNISQSFIYDDNGIIVNKSEYNYNKDGKVSKIIYYLSDRSEADSSIEYKYHSNGQTSHIIQYDYNSKFYRQEIYNKNGDITQALSYSNDKLAYKCEYEYDKNNNLIKYTITHEGNDDFNSTSEYKYNFKDEVKKITVYDEDGDIETERKFTIKYRDGEYTRVYKNYDKHGNYEDETRITCSNPIGYIDK